RGGRRSRRQPGDPAGAWGSRCPQGAKIQRPAYVAVHRQCRDDCLGGRRTICARHHGSAGCSAAGPLAARSGSGKGSRRGGESMRLGVIGGGAWGTALAQVAAASGRDTLLWALESDVVASVNNLHENVTFL